VPAIWVGIPRSRSVALTLAITVALVACVVTVEAAEGPTAPTAVIDATPFTIKAPESLLHQAGVVAAEAPRLASAVAASLGLPPATGGTIIVFGPDAASEELHQATIGIPSWAAGVTFPSSRTIVLRLDRIGAYGQRELLSVLTHELAHLIIAEALPDQGRGIPGWLGEGIASDAAREGEWRDLFIVWTSPLVSSPHPFEDLEAALDRGERSKPLAYAGSLAAVGFLKGRYGADLPARLLGELRRGAPFDAAFRASAGVGLDSAESAWARDLNLPWIWVVRLGSSFTVWMIATLLMLIAWAVKRARDRRMMERWQDEEGPRPVASDLRAAGEDPDDGETVH